MRRIIVLLALILLSTIVVAQDTALLVDITFLPDGSARFDDVQATFAGIDHESGKPLADGIKMEVDGTTYYQTYVPVTFVLMDARERMPEMGVTRRLPYFGNRGGIIITHDDKTVASFDLAQLCNNDGRCDRFENGISCPADCEIRVADKVCLPIQDGGCDPDCGQGLDPDCGKRAEPAPLSLYLFGVMMVLVALYWLYYLFWRR
jgi:hypothetical protein